MRSRSHSIARSADINILDGQGSPQFCRNFLIWWNSHSAFNSFHDRLLSTIRYTQALADQGGIPDTLVVSACSETHRQDVVPGYTATFSEIDGR